MSKVNANNTKNDVLASQLTEEFSRDWRPEEGEGVPVIFLVGGFVGSGKTTLAKAVSEKASFTLISADKIRQQLLNARVPRVQAEAVVNIAITLLIEKACSLNMSFVLDRNVHPARLSAIKDIVHGKGRRDYQIISILLQASEDALRQRILNRPHIPGLYKGNIIDLQTDLAKYKSLDPEVYDLVVDTENMTKKAISDLAIKKLNSIRGIEER